MLRRLRRPLPKPSVASDPFARAPARMRSRRPSSRARNMCPSRPRRSWRSSSGNTSSKGLVLFMKIVVTGSIAFDYLMSFPGKFTEHFLPEHMQRVSLSFLVDTMDKRRGGCAPNIAYTLALLGEHPRLMGTAGQDFDDYRRWLEAAGVDTSLVKQVPDKFTASFFCSTDVDSNQIASFYTGAMANAAELSFRTAGDVRMAIISPNDPAAMLQYAEECRALGISYVWDPGQQCARMSGDELLDGLDGAGIVISNDYEFELIRQKTGLDETAVVSRAGALIVTRGEHGCTIRWNAHRASVPAAAP